MNKKVKQETKNREMQFKVIRIAFTIVGSAIFNLALIDNDFSGFIYWLLYVPSIFIFLFLSENQERRIREDISANQCHINAGVWRTILIFFILFLFIPPLEAPLKIYILLVLLGVFIILKYNIYQIAEEEKIGSENNLITNN